MLLTRNTNSNMSSLAIAPKLLRLLKIIKFLRILRLLRVLKLKKVLYKLEEHLATEYLNSVFEGLKLLATILLINHMMAWIFYFIGTFNGDNNPDSWVYQQGLTRYSKMSQYIITYYWAFTTMATVGFGDITPFSNEEKVYAMGWMIISTGFNAYMIGALSTIFNRSSLIYQEMKLKSLHINQYLIYHDIPLSLRSKILTYLDSLVEYKQKNKLEENEVLDLLNDNLREQVIAYLNGRVLKDWKAFNSFDMVLISEITFMLFRRLYAMNDNVFEEDEKSNKMYFIGKGKIVLLHL